MGGGQEVTLSEHGNLGEVLIVLLAVLYCLNLPLTAIYSYGSIWSPTGRLPWLTV